MLNQIGVLADDLTGANGIGVEFSSFQFKTVVFQEIQELSRKAKGIDVVIVDTESRNLVESGAGDKVNEAAQAFKKLNPHMIVKKIDSLLRGWIGREIDIVMDTFSFEKCIFIASSPKVQRTTIGGYQLVQGKLLEQQSDVMDPSSDFQSSFIPAILSKQTLRKIDRIDLETVDQGLNAIIEQILRSDSQIIVADSETQEQLNKVVLGSYKAGIRFFAGTYGLGEALSRLHKKEIDRKTPLLVVAGSLSETTRKQVEKLEQMMLFQRLVIEYDELFFEGSIEQYAKQYMEKLTVCLNQGTDLIIQTSGSQKQVESLWELAKGKGYDKTYVSERIDLLLQHLIKPILPKFKGFIASGGETANSLFKLMNADGLNLSGLEILPATPYSRVFGGAYDGIAFLTKPGSFGSEDDLILISRFIKSLDNNQ